MVPLDHWQRSIVGIPLCCRPSLIFRPTKNTVRKIWIYGTKTKTFSTEHLCWPLFRHIVLHLIQSHMPEERSTQLWSFWSWQWCIISRFYLLRPKKFQQLLTNYFLKWRIGASLQKRSHVGCRFTQLLLVLLLTVKDKFHMRNGRRGTP